MKRRKMGKRESRRDFSRKSYPHPKNSLPENSSMLMRGGIRA